MESKLQLIAYADSPLLGGIWSGLEYTAETMIYLNRKDLFSIKRGSVNGFSIGVLDFNDICKNFYPVIEDERNDI